MTTGILTLSCPDRPGIVHAVSGVLVAHQANIVESAQFGDPDTQRFFMRTRFELPAGTELETVGASFAPIAAQFAMEWSLDDAARPARTLVMVSKLGHCLNDLLYRRRAGLLPIEIVAVVSNHPHLGALVESTGIPFHHVPVTAPTKRDAESRLLRLVDELAVDLVVLARYMQVLSNDSCTALAGRAINIHHSFLPAFVGAKPYHQAYERGVKLIGATAHYVTPDLDEGPIIEQDVERVDHAMDPTSLAAVGHEVEARVLARAVQWHAEHRVLRNGNRTVTFR